jgi:hypothetical protein
MGETHIFFTPFKGTKNVGVGPFIAGAVTTNGGAVVSAATGAMIGFKPSTDATKAITLGIGVSITPNVQILGAGFEPNQPPPSGETQVRYSSTTALGLLIILGASF